MPEPTLPEKVTLVPPVDNPQGEPLKVKWEPITPPAPPEKVTTVSPIDNPQGTPIEVKWEPLATPETPVENPDQEPGSPVKGWSGPIVPEEKTGK
jgi:hypothetical protein